MKKFLKITIIVILNIFFLFCILLLSDHIVYNAFAVPEKYYSIRPLDEPIPRFEYYIDKPYVMFTEFNGFFSGKDNFFSGRLPVGLKYSDKKPIVLFGDSYIYGQYLNPEQSFHYKLSEALKCPVYNRAVSGTAFATMYYQVDSDYSDTFYKEVPPSDTVIYLIINHHWWRTLALGDTYVLGKLYYMRYTPKKGKLVMDNYKNKFYNFIKSSYTIRYLNLKYIDWYLTKGKSGEKLTNLALTYFKETRRVLEKKWNTKIKFVVIFYQAPNIIHGELLKNKLKDNGFIVVDTNEITKEDLNSEKYMMKENLHPTEAAWELLTPLIIKEANL